jgi:hypothetical protein
MLEYALGRASSGKTVTIVVANGNQLSEVCTLMQRILYSNYKETDVILRHISQIYFPKVSGKVVVKTLKSLGSMNFSFQSLQWYGKHQDEEILVDHFVLEIYLGKAIEMYHRFDEKNYKEQI